MTASQDTDEGHDDIEASRAGGRIRTRHSLLSKIFITMAEKTTKPTIDHVSDDLFGVCSKWTHSVIRFRVVAPVVHREFSQTGKSRDAETPSTWTRQ